MQQDIFSQIQKMISSDDVVLFMKGNKNAPSCGFSAHVVNILKQLKINFQDYNVLQDNNLRSAIKQFSNWPTIPQLYFKGQFIGGCNIIDQMYKNGDLHQKILLQDNKI